MEMATLTYEDYKIGWICALPVEMTAAIAMLDEQHPQLQRAPGDDNTYVLGRVGDHNVAIASLPIGERGTNSAAQVAVQMLRTFQSIKIGLMVGIGGGVPSSEDIRLGDIVVSKPCHQNGGVFQYDLGRNLPSGLRNFGFLNAPPRSLRSAISALVAWHDIPNQNRIPDYLSLTKNPNLPARYAYPELESDELFKSEYIHEGHKTCSNCDRGNLIGRKSRSSRDPVVHYGTIASGNQIMRNGIFRDELAARHGILCFEMEAAGLMNTFPCVVIRGISHYADSHKYNRWRAYAAATAAAYAKELLRFLPVDQVSKTETIVASTDQGAASSSIVATQPQTALPSPTTIGDLTFTQPEQSILVSPLALGHGPNSHGGSIASNLSVLADGSLHWDHVVLGRLVLNLDNPGQDYYPPAPIAFAPEDISISPFKDIKMIFKQFSGSRFIEGLKKLLPTEIDGNTNVVDEIANQKLITYNLLNPEAVLDRLLENDDTKRWLEKFCRRSHIYFSVALHSFVSPSVSKSTDNSSIAQNDKAPSAMVPGDRIIGVRYRRLRFRKFCSTVDPGYLQQRGCWKIDDWNGDYGEESDSLKVTLDDTMSLDDLEDEYNFEAHFSDDTEETYVALVYAPYLQKLNAKVSRWRKLKGGMKVIFCSDTARQTNTFKITSNGDLRISSCWLEIFRTDTFI